MLPNTTLGLNPLKSVLLASVLLAAANMAHAQSTEMFTIAPIPSNTVTDFNRALAVTQFDPSLGTLISANIAFTYTIQTQVTATNVTSGANAARSSGNVKTNSTIGLTDPNGILPHPPYSGTGTPTAGAFSARIVASPFNYSLASGQSLTSGTLTGTGGVAQNFTSSNYPMILTELTGTGSVNFNASTYTIARVSNSGGSTTAAQTTTAGLTGSVTYTYTPKVVTAVPEPGSLSLLAGAGAAGLGMVRRRRRLA